ncbi:hypothetical protein ES703_43456 [subsurface metagenome]
MLVVTRRLHLPERKSSILSSMTDDFILPCVTVIFASGTMVLILVAMERSP